MKKNFIFNSISVLFFLGCWPCRGAFPAENHLKPACLEKSENMQDESSEKEVSSLFSDLSLKLDLSCYKEGVKEKTLIPDIMDNLNLEGISVTLRDVFMFIFSLIKNKRIFYELSKHLDVLNNIDLYINQENPAQSQGKWINYVKAKEMKDFAYYVAQEAVGRQELRLDSYYFSLADLELIVRMMEHTYKNISIDLENNEILGKNQNIIGYMGYFNLMREGIINVAKRRREKTSGIVSQRELKLRPMIGGGNCQRQQETKFLFSESPLSKNAIQRIIQRITACFPISGEKIDKKNLFYDLSIFLLYKVKSEDFNNIMDGLIKSSKRQELKENLEEYRILFGSEIGREGHFSLDEDETYQSFRAKMKQIYQNYFDQTDNVSSKMTALKKGNQSHGRASHPFELPVLKPYGKRPISLGLNALNLPLGDESHSCASKAKGFFISARSPKEAGALPCKDNSNQANNAPILPRISDINHGSIHKMGEILLSRDPLLILNSSFDHFMASNEKNNTMFIAGYDTFNPIPNMHKVGTTLCPGPCMLEPEELPAQLVEIQEEKKTATQRIPERNHYPKGTLNLFRPDVNIMNGTYIRLKMGPNKVENTLSATGKTHDPDRTPSLPGLADTQPLTESFLGAFSANKLSMKHASERQKERILSDHDKIDGLVYSAAHCLLKASQKAYSSKLPIIDSAGGGQKRGLPLSVDKKIPTPTPLPLLSPSHPPLSHKAASWAILKNSLQLALPAPISSQDFFFQDSVSKESIQKNKLSKKNVRNKNVWGHKNEMHPGTHDFTLLESDINHPSGNMISASEKTQILKYNKRVLSETESEDMSWLEEAPKERSNIQKKPEKSSLFQEDPYIIPTPLTEKNAYHDNQAPIDRRNQQALEGRKVDDPCSLLAQGIARRKLFLEANEEEIVPRESILSAYKKGGAVDRPRQKKCKEKRRDIDNRMMGFVDRSVFCPPSSQIAMDDGQSGGLQPPVFHKKTTLSLE